MLQFLGIVSAWILLSFPVGILIGKSVKLADRKENTAE